jgi:hypothetical protein
LSNYEIVDLRGECAFSAESLLYEEYSDGQNPFVSLVALHQTGGTAFGSRFCRIELLIEYAYNVKTFNYISTKNGWVLTIISGSCNAFGTNPSAIPHGTFNGFIVVNRDNMKSVKIVSQSGDRIVVENNEDAAKLLSNNPDLIIVPDFTHIEISAFVESNVLVPEIPFTKESGTADGRLRMALDVEYPDGQNELLNSTVNVKLKYRMFAERENRGRPFAFNTAQYHDYIEDVDKTLVSGNLDLNIGSLIPVAEQRNYS